MAQAKGESWKYDWWIKNNYYFVKKLVESLQD